MSLSLSYFYNCPWTGLCALLFLNLCFVHVAHTPHQKKKIKKKKEKKHIDNVFRPLIKQNQTQKHTISAILLTIH